MIKDFSALGDLTIWLGLEEGAQDSIIHDFNHILGHDYLFQYVRSYSDTPSLRIATFLHLPTEMEFNLIIGGSFDMGFSLQEEKAARAINYDLPFSPDFMRPVHTVQVKPFLMSRFPITSSFAQKHIEFAPDVFRPEFGESDDDIVPIYLTREEIDSLKAKFGFQLPSEAQWEYACRGGTKTLFYFGDNLPDETTLENRILLYNFNDTDACNKAANPFGLVGMAVGEWCEDLFHNDFTNASGNDQPVDAGPPYVIRGGAAALWPWQECDEWILCISAMRRSSDTLEDGTCGARFVKILDLDGCS